MATIEVLNQTKPVVEDTPVINLSMSNPIYRGPQGEKGDKGDRGEVGPQGIQGEVGPRGATGQSGVFVGTEEPTDESIVVWIDMTGDADLEPAEGGSY